MTIKDHYYHVIDYCDYSCDVTSLFNQSAKYRGIHDNILTRIAAFLSGLISIAEKWRVGCFEALIIRQLS